MQYTDGKPGKVSWEGWDFRLYRAVRAQAERNEAANPFWLEARYPSETVAMTLLERLAARRLREGGSGGAGVPVELARAWRCLLSVALRDAHGHPREAAQAIGAAVEGAVDSRALATVLQGILVATNVYGVTLVDIDEMTSIGATLADTFHVDPLEMQSAA